jgi:ubiquinone/menaquinone biosynthesis C-methylase UbiE
MSDAAVKYRRARRAHWDGIAVNERASAFSKNYHRRLTRIYRFLVPPNQKVLEIGCAAGDMLSQLHPSLGVGIDLSGNMVKMGAKRHGKIHFIQGDAHHLCLNQKFDVIILSDLVNDLWDVQRVFEQIRNITTPRTRIILNTYSRLWELPLKLAQRLGLGNTVAPSKLADGGGFDGLAQYRGF